MAAGSRRVSRHSLLAASGFVTLCTLAVGWPFVVWGRVPMPPDNIYYFYPLNNLTGRILRGGDLPVWNIHQMSGMPLMADPQAGWGSVAAMISYTLLPLAEAAGVLLWSHLVIAGIGTLLFLRSTGVSVPGATLGALAYALTGQVLGPWIDLSYGNFSYVGALSWLPWLLLGVDIAVRHRGYRRLGGWVLTAFAASQVLSTWLGQGAYYDFGVTAAYLLFLTLLGSPAEGRTVKARLQELSLHSAAMGALTVGLAAWTLFPRLELLMVSNLSGGYSVGQQQFEGGSSARILKVLFQGGKAYIGAAILLLVLATPWLRPKRAQWFYLATAALAYFVSLEWMVRSARDYGLLRSVYGLVPGVLQLHLHYPERVAYVYLFFVAALAGTNLDALLAARGKMRVGLGGAVLIALLAILVMKGRSSFWSYGACALGVTLCVGVVVLCWNQRLSTRAASVLLVSLTGVELVVTVTGAHSRYFRLGRPDSYYTVSGVGLGLLESNPGSARYFGYDPQAVRSSGPAYRGGLYSSLVRDLMVTTQATVLGLEDTQGYNPVHLQVYDRLLAVANGQGQHYRNAYILPEGVNSPLLDILNAPHVLVRKGTRLGRKYYPVAEQGDLQLYVNRWAMPRAWVVHDVRVANDDEALQSIHNRSLNPRRAAFVSRPLEERLMWKRGPEEVMVTHYSPDRIEVTAELTSAGLLVLSELDYPAWKVKVDGVPRTVVRANGALRAVRVPRGTHKVTWYYNSTWTSAGFAVTTFTLLGLSVAFLLHVSLAKRA